MDCIYDSGILLVILYDSFAQCCHEEKLGKVYTGPSALFLTTVYLSEILSIKIVIKINKLER